MVFQKKFAIANLNFRKPMKLPRKHLFIHEEEAIIRIPKNNFREEGFPPLRDSIRLLPEAYCS